MYRKENTIFETKKKEYHRLKKQNREKRVYRQRKRKKIKQKGRFWRIAVEMKTENMLKLLSNYRIGSVLQK